MTRNPKIPHYIRDMDFSLRKISHPAHAGIRNDRKEGRNDKNSGYSKLSKGEMAIMKNG